MKMKCNACGSEFIPSEMVLKFNHIEDRLGELRCPIDNGYLCKVIPQEESVITEFMSEEKI